MYLKNLNEKEEVAESQVGRRVKRSYGYESYSQNEGDSSQRANQHDLSMVLTTNQKERLSLILRDEFFRIQDRLNIARSNFRNQLIGLFENVVDGDDFILEVKVLGLKKDPTDIEGVISKINFLQFPRTSYSSQDFEEKRRLFKSLCLYSEIYMESFKNFENIRSSDLELWFKPYGNHKYLSQLFKDDTTLFSDVELFRLLTTYSNRLFEIFKDSHSKIIQESELSDIRDELSDLGKKASNMHRLAAKRYHELLSTKNTQSETHRDQVSEETGTTPSPSILNSQASSVDGITGQAIASTRGVPSEVTPSSTTPSIEEKTEKRDYETQAGFPLQTSTPPYSPKSTQQSSTTTITQNSGSESTTKSTPKPSQDEDVNMSTVAEETRTKEDEPTELPTTTSTDSSYVSPDISSPQVPATTESGSGVGYGDSASSGTFNTSTTMKPKEITGGKENNSQELMIFGGIVVLALLFLGLIGFWRYRSKKTEMRVRKREAKNEAEDNDLLPK